MNLVESIFRGGMQLRADTTGAPAGWDNFWYQPVGGQASSAGMRVSPETSKRLGTVIACVSYRAKMFSILPCKVRRDLTGGGSEALPTHPWARALSIRPNPVQTALDFRYMMNAHVDLRGNAYALKLIRGDQRELWPLHPDRVRVEVIKASGLPRYKYFNPLTNETEIYTRDQIFHLRDWSDNMWIGQSRISMALDPLGLALARQDYMARFMKNDARTGFAIVGTNFKNKEDEKTFRENLQKEQTGENRGKALVLGTGLDVKAIGVSPVDAQLIEGKKTSDTEICSIFGVLPHAVGVDAGKAATFASTEQFNIMNAQQCMHPIVVMWEQAQQRDLLDAEEDDSYSRYSMAALLRGDNATRFQGYAIALGSQGPAWMVPDEVRELEDLNPMENGQGKVAWRPLNMAPLNQLTPTAPDADAGDEDTDEEGDAPEDGAGSDRDTKNAQRARKGMQKPAMQARLQLLASNAAARCMRKEASAVRRMIEHNASYPEIAQFYAEHSRFTADVLQLGAGGSLEVHSSCERRAQHLASLLSDEEGAEGAALAWIEQVATSELSKLAALAVREVN